MKNISIWNKLIKTMRLSAVLVLALFVFAGCGSFPMVITTAGDKVTVELKKAEDGHTGESGLVSVGKGEVVTIDSALENGKLRIEFAEAIVIYNTDEPDDVIAGGVVRTVAAGPGDSLKEDLEPGDYVLQVTAIGTTDGKVTVSIGKE